MSTEYELSYTAEEIDERLSNAGNAVLYTEQNLTPEQQAQARANILAVSIDDLYTVSSQHINYVHEQNLTEEQKEIARKNIGAISANLGTYKIPYTDGTGEIKTSYGWTANGNSPYTFVLRTEGGQVRCGEPVLDDAATTKSYVDNAIEAAAIGSESSSNNVETLANSLVELWKPYTSEYWNFSGQPNAAYNATSNIFAANISTGGSVLAVLKENIDATYIDKLYLHIENDMPAGAAARAIVCCYDENGNVITTAVSGWSYLAFYEGYFFNATTGNDYKQFNLPEGTKSIRLKFSTAQNSSTLEQGVYNFRISVRKEEVVTRAEVQQIVDNTLGDAPTQLAMSEVKFNNIVDTFDGGIFIGDAAGVLWTNTTYKGVNAIVCDISSFAGKTVRVLYDSFETEISSAAETCKITLYIAQKIGDGSALWTYPDSDGVLKISDEATEVNAVFYIEYTGLTSNANRSWMCKNFRVFECGKFNLSPNIEVAALNELRRDRFIPNTTFVAKNNLIRKAYNPYSSGGSQLLSGQMHCHSKFYDEQGVLHYYAGTDENLCKIHADAGYDFITITDYSHTGEVCQKPEDTHGLTWLCNSQEAAVTGDALNVGEHMCIYNSDRVWEFNKSESPECVGKFVREYGSVASLAHPFWSSLPQYEEKLNRIKDAVKFCEVYTGLCVTDGEITLPDGKSYDYAWEIMLDNGCATWGIAVNDAHHSSDATGGISNGCVKVFVNENTAPDIWDALLNGNFVACSNINADILSVSFKNGVYTVTTSNAATVKFLKEGGSLLQETSGTANTYTINGDEKYVRAVITDNNGHTVWTQPVVILNN